MNFSGVILKKDGNEKYTIGKSISKWVHEVVDMENVDKRYEIRFIRSNESFKRELKVLKRLKKKGAKFVPKVLDVGQITHYQTDIGYYIKPFSGLMSMQRFIDLNNHNLTNM